MFVSAGDLEKYSFCPLSWWLSKKFKIIKKKGVVYHAQAETELKEIEQTEKKITIYEKYVLAISIFASLVAIAGITFLYGAMERFWEYFFVVMALLWLLNSVFFLYRSSKTESFLKVHYEKLLLLTAMGAIGIASFSVLFSFSENPDISRFTSILALLWIITASLMFYRSLYLSDRILTKKIKYVPLKGKIEYIGANQTQEPLTSKTYNIRGTPDYIIQLDNEYIPVEEKSSNAYSPPFPHVIQITAYCMMVQDAYGIAPPYGIIKYKNAEFKIPYEQRWIDLVVDIRQKIIDDTAKGEAHRNHYNGKKCSHCNVRENCPEKLM
jgi:CRISPR-associated exonuclease Cas4